MSDALWKSTLMTPILSRELVQIVTDLKLEFDHEDFKYELAGNDELLELLDSLNFKTIKSKLSSGSGGHKFFKAPKLCGLHFHQKSERL